MPDHEILDVDVLFVGAGPGGLAGSIRLAQLARTAGRTLNITVIDKAREIGAHTCSGAVMDPKALRELVPDFEAQGAPIESPVEEDFVWFLTQDEGVGLPFVPPMYPTAIVVSASPNCLRKNFSVPQKHPAPNAALPVIIGSILF
jgi:electron-transferring-flavoprotein dehydrogenase